MYEPEYGPIWMTNLQLSVISEVFDDVIKVGWNDELVERCMFQIKYIVRNKCANS